LNHANINVDYGWLKYILNNPKMHIWHHSKELPAARKFGVNFGLTLSIWDYFFKTNYIPHSGRDIEIGFEGDERFPKGFIAQELYPFNKT
jgi:sterol desaturase/sphingolipid hydroxylase (fatty acid hydroxylase superfamily)